MSLQSPLAKARGLGSAKAGRHHWWQQRLTAVALVPLSLWFLASLATLSSLDHSMVITWLSRPLNAVLLIMFIIILFHHTQLGVQVVIEDYIESEWQKLACIIVVQLLALFAALAAILSVLKVSLGL